MPLSPENVYAIQLPPLTGEETLQRDRRTNDMMEADESLHEQHDMLRGQIAGLRVRIGDATTEKIQASSRLQKLVGKLHVADAELEELTTPIRRRVIEQMHTEKANQIFHARNGHQKLANAVVTALPSYSASHGTLYPVYVPSRDALDTLSHRAEVQGAKVTGPKTMAPEEWRELEARFIMEDALGERAEAAELRAALAERRNGAADLLAQLEERIHEPRVRRFLEEKASVLKNYARNIDSLQSVPATLSGKMVEGRLRLIYQLEEAAAQHIMRAGIPLQYTMKTPTDTAPSDTVEEPKTDELQEPEANQMEPVMEEAA